MKNSLHTTISVIVTAHAESILTHRTIRSVRRAIERLPSKWRAEIILHVDNGTEETINYIESNADFLGGVSIYYNQFGDLGSSRNFAIKQANGKYIATIDADDIMSENWLLLALNELERRDNPSIVAHSEFTIEFEGADSFIIKHGAKDTATDTLLSVYANRWNSVIIAPRTLLLENPYTPNTPGYGYEDWNLNCRFIFKGVQNILIPETAIFVRRKRDNSEWLRQIVSMSVLRSNDALSFENIRSLKNPFDQSQVSSHAQDISSKLKRKAKEIIKSRPALLRTARFIKNTTDQQASKKQQESVLPRWLQTEWMKLHTIDRQIFLSQRLKFSIPTYDTISPDHKFAGSLYKQLVDSLQYNHYDYLIFVPWLVKGGADKYAIEYANTINSLRPDKKVLVVGTLDTESPWQSLLDTEVDFLDFGTITASASVAIKYRLMEHVIENGNISHIHIINSEFGYDFVKTHEKYLRSTNKKVLATSFSQSIDTSGRTFGYSHTHVPQVYDLLSLITSDNQAVIDMWKADYGFNPAKMVVHRQPVAIDKAAAARKHTKSSPITLLWAARIAPEKTPETLLEIAKLLPANVTIDMYGSIEKSQQLVVDSLPDNITYKGTFDGFSSLPLREYDALIYTSLFDGMPNTLLEAAQHALPIIAPRVGGIPEFINNMQTGILIEEPTNAKEYVDAIKKIGDPSLRSTLAQGAIDKLKTDFSSTAYKNSVSAMLDLVDF